MCFITNIYFYFKEYVADIFECLITTPRQELKVIRDEMKDTTPEPRYHMLECEPKEEAIRKHKLRQEKQTTLVPATCSGN